MGNIDTNEILDKINEFDMNKLNQMGISLDEIKSKVTEKDFEKLIKFWVRTVPLLRRG